MHETPLHWGIDTASIAHAPADFSYQANAAERETLKRHADIEDITSFTAEVKTIPLAGGRFRLSGTLKANIVQASVVDLAAVPSVIEENFSVEFWPAGFIEDAGGEALPFDSDPPEPIEGGRIAVGAFLYELFAVSLDPYPRNEGDTFEWTPSHPEPEASPFAALALLRPRKTPENG